MGWSMLKNSPTLQNDIGDTIVEVLISIAFLGLAFGIAYNIAIKSSSRIENNQFQSQATQILQSQVELLRENIATDAQNFNGSTYNCFGPLNDPEEPETNCTTQTGPGYTVSISAPTNGIYTVTITWESEYNGSQQTESVYYTP